MTPRPLLALRRSARRRLARALHRRGIYRLGPAPFGVIDKEQLLEAFGTTLVFDVGANVGMYGASLRKLGYRGRIVSFEPGREAFAELEARAAADPLWEAHNVGIGAAEREAVLNVASASVSSSFLAMGDRFETEVPGTFLASQESVAMRPLDAYLDRIEGSDRVWVKLDVEGYELEAIAGAEALLGRTHVLELELATERLYEDEPLFFDVAPAVYALGLQLVAVAPASISPTGRTRRFDGLFVRP